MDDFSTERLAPSSWIRESKPQENQREPARRVRRKPPPSRSSEQEEQKTPDPEVPTHRVDRLA
jgi:hypothetical protein